MKAELRSIIKSLLNIIKHICEIVRLLILIGIEYVVKFVIKCKQTIHFVSAVLAVFVLVVDVLVSYKGFKEPNLFGQVFPQVLILSALFYVLGMLSIFTGKENNH
ncbi:hypothetical protein [Anaerosporobacter sp.]